MTTKPNDDEAAFPSITTFFSDKTKEYELGKFITGMSLRDYFAAHAISGLAHARVFESGTCVTNQASAAKLAYEYADAMLAEREREK